MTELKASLETIQTTAKELITEIEGHFTELQQQRQAEQEQGDTFSIYQLKRGDETRDLRFEPYDRLQAAGLTIDCPLIPQLLAQINPSEHFLQVWYPFK